MRPKARQLLPLAAAITLVVAISAAMAWRLYVAPDEGSHVAMVRHHAHSLRPVSWEDWQYGTRRGHAYYLYSPLPYAVYIPFEWADDLIGPVEGPSRPDWFLIRLGGLVVAVAQLGLTIAIVRRMCDRCGLSVVVVVAVVANLIPQLRALHAYVNADAVTILVGTACFAVALRVLQSERVTGTDTVLVGVTVGLAALTRANIYVIPVLLLAVFATQVLRQRVAMRTRMRFLGVALAVPLLMSGPFHLYVYDELQNRHVVATSDSEQLTDSTFSGEIRDRPTVRGIVRMRIHQVDDVWRTTWAWLPEHGKLDRPWTQVLAALVIPGIVGLVLPARRVLTKSGRAVGLAAVVAVVAIWILMSTQWLVTQWGRYLLPAGVTALAAMILGTAALIARSKRLDVNGSVFVAAMTWGALLLGLNMWSVIRISA